MCNGRILRKCCTTGRIPRLNILATPIQSLVRRPRPTPELRKNLPGGGRGTGRGSGDSKGGTGCQDRASLAASDEGFVVLFFCARPIFSTSTYVESTEIVIWVCQTHTSGHVSHPFSPADANQIQPKLVFSMGR